MTAAIPELIHFEVEADYMAAIADTIANITHDPDIIPITGNVTFTPLVNSGDVLLATQTSPRPIGLILTPITGIIDVDGRLKLREVADDGVAEFAPVRLVADCPILELKSPLFYRVSYSNIKIDGKAGSIAPFTFQAPNADVVVNLIGLQRQPGQPASGITKISPGAVRLNEQGQLVFSFGGVDIPDPIDLGIDLGSLGTIDPVTGGIVGPAGPAGPPGPPGQPGEPGPEWFFGDGEPQLGIVGARPGDLYLDRLTGTIYRLGDSYIK